MGDPGAPATPPPPPPPPPPRKRDTKAHSSSQPEPPMSTDMLSWIGGKARQVGGACLDRAGPLLITCLCIALVYRSRNKKREAKERPVRPMLQRSVSMAALHGGKVALQRIIDSQEARVDQASLDNAAAELRELLTQEPLSFNRLQRVAAKLEMSGKEDEAVEMLHQAWKKADEGGQPHEAHELQMMLVEMLIYKGEYQKALDCKCLNDKAISDARGPLYKAIIYTITGNRPQAEICYKEFKDIRSRFHLSDSLSEGTPLYGAVHDFESFEMVVKNMKKEIEHAHKT